MVILTLLAGSASAFAQTAPATQFYRYAAFAFGLNIAAVVKNNRGARPQPQAARMTAGPVKRIGVIVKLKDAPLATYKGDVPGLAATSPVVTGADKVDPQSPASKQYLSYLDAKQDAFVALPSRLSHRRGHPTARCGGQAVAMQVPADQIDTLKSAARR